MPIILGLDIGTNSVGWALIESSPAGNALKVIALGTRVFPEGVDRDQQGAEHSKNEQRRIARGMRRQIARRARRRAALRKALVVAGLLPADCNEQKRLDELDPYLLREAALSRKLELYELGRVLVHLNQRRGFLSNRKADRGRAKENEGLLKEIGELAGKMGSATLGQYLAERMRECPAERVRGLHTRRDMFMDEFLRIWEYQQKFYPELLTQALCYGERGPQEYPRKPLPLPHRKSNSLSREFGLFGILFFQRALYWPKSVVGRCELEPREKRCPRADRVAQRFRLLQEVNNLHILPEFGEQRPLTPDERTKVIAGLGEKKERTFDDLRKLLGLLSSDVFNLERADRKKLLGLPVDYALSRPPLFGSGWYKRPEAQKDEIVRSLLDDEDEDIRRKATENWGCSNELAERLVEFDLTAIADGYSAYSLKAMENLLPFLERGLRLMANDETDSALHAAGYLRPDQKVVKQSEWLPDVPPEIANPIVRQALYEVRQLLHAVIREFGRPDHIHVELAREAKGNAIQRAKYIADMRDRERKRDAAANWLREHGIKPSREAIERYLLWEEQGEICPYSGRPITPGQLFGGEIDVDHILPYSRSLDNSLMNKVVCFRSENSRKGQQTPYEWVGESDLHKFERIIQSVRRLPFPKRERFNRKELVLDDFLNRQLTDTAYITRKMTEYLQCLGIDIVCTKGQSTAELRRMWGLNSVLHSEGLNLKNRDDHRHHAIDALVIALTDRSRLQQLAKTMGSDDELPPPWKTFRDDVEELTDGIKVSHRVQRKLAGALHEETIYGPTSKPDRATAEPRRHAPGWIEEPGVFVVRKPLAALTPAMIDEIRDPQVREIVLARLREFGIEDHRKAGKLPKDIWEKDLYMTRKDGRQSANANKIKFVRVLRRDQTIQPIRGGTACVKPGNTHHICLFELPDSTAEKPKREMIAISMLDAMQRNKLKQPIIQRKHPALPDARFLFSLSRGEMLLIKHKGDEDLYRFETAAGTSKQMWFRIHTYAGKSADKTGQVSKMPNTLDAVKVVVDPLGRIRNAND